MPEILHAPLEFGLCLAGVLCLLIAALQDVMARTSPDWAALGLLACGAALRLLQGDLPIGLLVGLAMFMVTAFCWRRGWMGGGDVKLLTGAAVLVPPSQTLIFVLAVTLSGGVLALLYLAGKRIVPAPAPVRPRGLLARALRAERWRIRRGGPLPYACAIAAGGLIVLL